MARPAICDQRDCPAPALHDVVLHGQDFHFCGHHWAELAPALLASLDTPGPRTPTDAAATAGPDRGARWGRTASAPRR